MELKKNPKADLESKRQIFLQIGLILSLSITVFAYEFKTYDKIAIDDIKEEKVIDDDEDIEITRAEEKKPPPPPPEEPPPPAPPEEIEVVEDDKEVEDIIFNDQNDDTVAFVYEEEEEVFEEAWISVEKMPTLGDCKDEKDLFAKEACTQKAIMTFIARNFKYPEIAKANGIEGRVIIDFVVEKDGKVGRVEIKKGTELDKYIDKEAIRVIEALPLFEPGKQIGKTVPVKYTVPIKCTLG